MIADRVIVSKGWPGFPVGTVLRRCNPESDCWSDGRTHSVWQKDLDAFPDLWEFAQERPTPQDYVSERLAAIEARLAAIEAR